MNDRKIQNEMQRELAMERDEARAIARGLSNPLRYHAERGCQLCAEHVADFDALPWAKEPADG